MKGVKVSDYGGRTLGISDSTVIEINPDMPEAHRLRGWYDSAGQTSHFETYSTGMTSVGSGKDLVKSIAQITDENLGMGDKVL